MSSFKDAEFPEHLKITQFGRADICRNCSAKAYWKFYGEFGDMSFCEDCLGMIIRLALPFYKRIIWETLTAEELSDIINKKEADKVSKP